MNDNESGVTEFVSSGMDTDTAAATLLAKWEPEEKDQEEKPVSKPKEPADLSEEEEQGEQDSKEEPDEESDSEEPTEESDDTKSEPTEAPDTAVIKYKVGDEEFTTTVGEIRRLAGQEKALTQKGQHLAEQRKAYEENAKYQAAVLDKVYSKAKARWQEYAGIDFALAATQMDREAYTQLRTDAQEAYKDLQFIESEVVTYVKKLEGEKQKSLQTQAKESLKVLQDPVNGIPGFNRELYSEIRNYAIKSGMPVKIVDSLVDPLALKMVYKAMQHDKGAEASAKIVRKPKAATKVASPEKATSGDSGKDTVKKAMSKLSREKDSDSAAEALMARWAAQS